MQRWLTHVLVNAESLEPGEYDGAVEIVAKSSDNSEWKETVPVSMRVRDRVTPIPAGLVVSLPSGSVTASKSLKLMFAEDPGKVEVNVTHDLAVSVSAMVSDPVNRAMTIGLTFGCPDTLKTTLRGSVTVSVGPPVSAIAKIPVVVIPATE
ncbi:MAG: hypothetical protein ACK5Q5_00140 [Planctomycetaceae bacterium]